MKDGHPGELGENCSWPTCEIKVKKSKGLNAAIHPELWGYLSCPHKLHFFFFCNKDTYSRFAMFTLPSKTSVKINRLVEWWSGEMH
jgi:hypothetical protein